MKKFIKLISCSVFVMALIISTQLCVMASVTSGVASSQIASSIADTSPAATSPASSRIETVSGASLANDIAPYDTTGTPNPRTGAQNLAIPGVVAILAAATAAVTLAGKKK